MNSNYHLNEFMVKERIQTQQQAAAAHRLARLAASPKPAAPGRRQRATAQILTMVKGAFGAMKLGGGLLRGVFDHQPVG